MGNSIKNYEKKKRNEYSKVYTEMQKKKNSTQCNDR